MPVPIPAKIEQCPASMTGSTQWDWSLIGSMPVGNGGFHPLSIFMTKAPPWTVAARETVRGRLDLEAYWGPKLAHAVIGAFEVDALFPETDGVCLDYRAFDGTPVRIHFRFTDEGKIRHNACAPVKQAA